MEPGEIITIHVGGMGIRSAENFWKKMCKNYKVDYNGKASQIDKNLNQFFKTTYDRLRPRSVFADLCQNDIEYIKNFELKNLFNPNSLIYSQGEDGNWATGHYTEGAELIDKIISEVRKEAESADNLKGILNFSSISGGVGGGLGSLITAKINEEYSSKSIIGIHDYPSDKNSKTNVDPYNSILTTHL
jgi:tubulin beta